MTWVTVRAIGSRPSSRRGPGVTPTLYNEMSLLRNSLLSNMREEAPVNKNPSAPNRGALRKSIRASPWMTNGTIWRTEFTALEYIRYVIHGTRPHRIEAKPGGVLAFSWSGAGVSGSLPPISHLTSGMLGRLGRRGGTSIFSVPPGHVELRGGTLFLRFAVNHPGTQANNFVQRAVDRTMRLGTPGFTKRVQQAIEDDLLQLVMVA
ncbi:MAG TPA: hypothetical protein VGU71_22270 [Candidatus Dormibacteraeota bacterium]|nr:hypothetical protein [Candidatus Dormibacteraeota bacterium]